MFLTLFASVQSVEATEVTFGPGRVNFTGINTTTIVLPKKTDEKDVYFVIHNPFAFETDGKKIPAPVYKNVEEINLTFRHHKRPILEYTVLGIEANQCDTVDFVFGGHKNFTFGNKKFDDVELKNNTKACVAFVSPFETNYTVKAINASASASIEVYDYNFENGQTVLDTTSLNATTIVARLTTADVASGLFIVSQRPNFPHPPHNETEKPNFPRNETDKPALIGKFDGKKERKDRPHPHPGHMNLRFHVADDNSSVKFSQVAAEKEIPDHHHDENHDRKDHHDRDNKNRDEDRKERDNDRKDRDDKKRDNDHKERDNEKKDDDRKDRDDKKRDNDRKERDNDHKERDNEKKDDDRKDRDDKKRDNDRKKRDNDHKERDNDRKDRDDKKRDNDRKERDDKKRDNDHKERDDEKKDDDHKDRDDKKKDEKPQGDRKDRKGNKDKKQHRDEKKTETKPSDSSNTGSEEKGSTANSKSGKTNGIMNNKAFRLGMFIGVPVLAVCIIAGVIAAVVIRCKKSRRNYTDITAIETNEEVPIEYNHAATENLV
ncbi:hypothetical protein TVAG_151720 [Trichomonas vaginalis G3]|uniref:Uncharacterized protein n=1 Tax=Trichomonas vaginalis (strain ATCC PRA-98 / G3) TaxID=412133 RepID=A2ELT7_TRIV3|nr:hypothetical protein TVAGG3_0401060 [Trichomonas vaginalis G3]EAY06365.1 hypothetical protein TVAG_151720 [Trichomonas vaginalis G3]KAI5534695.1 hypothetical protein TVAGG3_0401060 [Trichomonas vaginalis G3]|eukprot:XP_001318588.1 hypothetical protein [Trichomonas vaginalis G3]